MLPAIRVMTARIDLCRLLNAALVLAIAACNYNEKPSPPPPGMSVTNAEKRAEVKAPAAVATISTGLAGPESVLYDPEQDVYFISNINGGLLDRHNNGFISRVDANTRAVNLKWIAGGQNHVTLDAPKGMAILGESLYVSDVIAVRKFDRRTGAFLAAILLPGATLINDLTTDGKKIYASDTGVVQASGDTFTPKGTDAIWVIENDRATKFASGTDLRQPNGLDWSGGKLWVVTFGDDRLYSLEGGKVGTMMHLPRAQLDGVVRLSDGTFLVTSWKGSAVYRGNGSGPWDPILQNVPTPADIGYDSKRHLLLLPVSSQNSVRLHPVQ